MDDESGDGVSPHANAGLLFLMLTWEIKTMEID